MTSVRRSKPDPIPEATSGYRLGLEASHLGESKSLALLNTALEAYLAKGDVEGAALTSAALLITGTVMANYRRFPEHIARLAPVRDSAYRWNNSSDELLALTGMLSGMNFFGHDDLFIDTCVERILTLIERDLDVNTKFAAGRAILYYTEPREARALGQRVYSVLQPYLDHPKLTPHRLGHWLFFWTRYAGYAKETKQADLAEQRCRQLANSHNLRDILFQITAIEMFRGLAEKNIAKTEQALLTAEELVDPSRLGQLMLLELIRTKAAAMKGQGELAVFHASRGTKYAIELECPPVMRAVYIVNESQARLMIDDFSTANQLMRQAAEMVPDGYAEEIRDNIALTESYQAMSAGELDARERLARTWAAIRERRCYDAFEGFPEFCAKLCVLALDQVIEVEFVKGLIEARKLAPPENAPESWPWTIRVHAFGGFAVQRHGVQLASEGKTQKKPMELLRALVALGGHGIAKQKLYDLLWPDAAVTAAAATLDVVISRLRKLLGEPDAIRIEEGKVGLNPELVWLDVWAFDRDVEALQSALHAKPDVTMIDSLGQRILTRYTGPFLGSEEPQRWSLVARDRWQNRFRRSLSDAGRYWEQQNDWPRALALYERALEEDSLAEELYRRLMRGHIARGEPADAARVYRRCREMLSVQLGIPPSADTVALFKSIYKN